MSYGLHAAVRDIHYPAGALNLLGHSRWRAGFLRGAAATLSRGPDHPRRVALAAIVATVVTMLAPPAGAEAPTELDGLLEPDMLVDLASPVPGVIESVKVDRSDLIRKDEVVAQLKDGVQVAQVVYAQARVELSGEIKAKQAALDYAEGRNDRTSALYEKKVISLDDRAEAEAKARVARQDLNAAMEKRKLAGYELAVAQEDLAQRVIRSPIDGVVVERFMQPGNHVDEDPIVRIAKVDPLQVEVVVPLDYFDAIKPGMQARVVPELPIDVKQVATVTRVDRVVDAASGTFTVRLKLPNPGGKLPSGLRCKVIFPQGLTKVYTRKDEQSSAMTAANGSPAPTPAVRREQAPRLPAKRTPSEATTAPARTSPTDKKVRNPAAPAAAKKLAQLSELPKKRVAQAAKKTTQGSDRAPQQRVAETTAKPKPAKQGNTSLTQRVTATAAKSAKAPPPKAETPVTYWERLKRMFSRLEAAIANRRMHQMIAQRLDVKKQDRGAIAMQRMREKQRHLADGRDVARSSKRNQAVPETLALTEPAKSR